MRKPPRSRPRATRGEIVETRCSTWTSVSLISIGDDRVGDWPSSSTRRACSSENGVEADTRTGAVERDQPGARVQRVEHRGQVAEAGQDLRVTADPLELQVRQQARATPSSAHGQDSLDLGIGDQHVDVSGAVHVPTREVPVAVDQVRAALHLESQGAEHVGDDLDVLAQEGGAGGIDQPDRVARGEPARLDRRRAAGRARSAAPGAAASTEAALPRNPRRDVSPTSTPLATMDGAHAGELHRPRHPRLLPAHRARAARRRASQEKDYYRLNDSVNDLSCGILEQVVEVFLKTALFAGYLFVYERYRVVDDPQRPRWRPGSPASWAWTSSTTGSTA